MAEAPPLRGRMAWPLGGRDPAAAARPNDALRQSGDAHGEASVWQLRSYVMSDLLGRLDEATSSAQAAIAAGARPGSPMAVVWAHLVLAQVQLRGIERRLCL